jgi:hypothetical protein
MAFIEYSVSKSDISYEGTIEVEEFIEHIREWLEQHGYYINEKTYLGLPYKKTDIKWECSKKYDDYTKMFIKVKMSITSKEEMKIKRKIIDGTLKFEYEGEIKRDQDDKWVGKSSFIWRAFFDKFIALEKEKAVKKELTKDINDLAKEVKKYLNL